MSFRITGLDPAPFRPLYGLDDAALAARGARRCIADARPGYPDRIELRDAEPGERLILLNYLHQPANTPYRSSHAIFVREGAETRCDLIDAIPTALAIRPISLRAFDNDGEMKDARLIDGDDLKLAIEAMLEHEATAYLHAHYATRGCYAARVDRA
ncbi:DUF1203 domain-containing protein [Flavisphingomonas formosensis]|uniref:DUF1203 domain-containing protein n=1 Tax=Flavisphingomonas formosensis TaxID=861534 RepID=UPI0012FBED94|nr:DUF1203 domain-containing protein [Sphingomonas formosensis]